LPSVVVTEAVAECTVARERFTAAEDAAAAAAAAAALPTLGHAMAAIVEVGTTAIVELDPTGIVVADTTAGAGATTDGVADIGATRVTATDGDSVLALAGGPIGQGTRIHTDMALGGIPTIRIMRLMATHTLTMGTTTIGTTTMGTTTLLRPILDRDLATTLR